MYKRFEFEGDIHSSLECVPLTVRRKLDLAGIKISLDGWQRFPREERLCLCHLPVESPLEIDVYREVLLAFCEKRGAATKPLHDPAVDSRLWNSATLPPAVRERTEALRASLDDVGWSELDEESRYALLKLADPKRNPEKIEAALVELGLLAGPAPAIDPSVSVCDVHPESSDR